MIKIYKIDNWNIKRWIQTGGTREKCFVENPVDGKLYFFKESIPRYPSEFWSEIISSKIGALLGFDLLDYNIGILHNTVGCICESMVNQRTEELDHGINLIKNSVPGFKISERPVILFTDVEKSFQNYGGFINRFIDILVFDAIIGNQDRHSENWAVIRSLDTTHEKYNKKKIAIRLYEIYKRTGLRLKNIPFKSFFLKYMNKAEIVNIKFSPIYDSGSSLGREIAEDRIPEFLSNSNRMNQYILNGKSEVKWDKARKKINHFELLTFIRGKYKTVVKSRIEDVISNYDGKKVSDIILNIDNDIPKEFEETKLSLQRKELIIKFIDLRVNLLKESLD